MEKFEGFDKNLLNFLKTYNYIKKDNVLMKLAEELEKVEEKANESKDFTTLETFKDIEDNLKEISSEIMKHTSVSQMIESEKLVTKKKVRVYMDGVFDIIHSGHFNALRQGRRLGDVLVLGINSDEDVEKAKGPTLMNIKERSALARACKWVDIVLEDTPYTPTIEFLDQIGADYCAHGDDMPVNEHGVGCYDQIKNAGRLKVFKRTEGISTTEIIGRLLSCVRNVSQSSSEVSSTPITSYDLVKKVEEHSVNDKPSEEFKQAPIMSSFLSTGRRLHEFCNNKIPRENDRVIYVDGAFDILHIGHIEILKKARELGDFLYVGVHDDKTVNFHRGKNYPILNLQERVFNLLALKYVDDVVIAAPWTITEDLIKSLKISLVVQGTQTKYDEEFTSVQNDPYAYCKQIGIYKQILSEYDMNSEVLVKRIFEKRDHYLKKYQKKSNSEKGYYENKQYLQEI